MAGSPATFGTFRRNAAEDIPFLFYPPDDTASLSGAVLHMWVRNIEDPTDFLRTDGGSPDFSQPTYNASPRTVSALLPTALTATRAGNTYKVEVWRTDGTSNETIIEGTLVIEETARLTPPTSAQVVNFGTLTFVAGSAFAITFVSNIGPTTTTGWSLSFTMEGPISVSGATIQNDSNGTITVTVPGASTSGHPGTYLTRLWHDDAIISQGDVILTA